MVPTPCELPARRESLHLQVEALLPLVGLPARPDPTDDDLADARCHSILGTRLAELEGDAGGHDTMLGPGCAPAHRGG